MRDWIALIFSAFATASFIASIGDPIYAIGSGLLAIAAAIVSKGEGK